MAIIVEDAGLLFVLSPRTASTALGEGVLVEQLGGRWVPEANILDADGNIVVDRKHSSVRQLLEHGVIDDSLLDRVLVFTTVRNPFDSLVSMYVKQRDTYAPLLEDPHSWVHKNPGFTASMEVATKLSFSDWVRWRHSAQTWWGRLARYLRPSRHMYRRYLVGCDRVLRYEHLQDDFDRVLAARGLGSIEVPRRNVTEERGGHRHAASEDSDRDYRSYYDDSARRLVARVYGRDLREFGYSF